MRIRAVFRDGAGNIHALVQTDGRSDAIGAVGDLLLRRGEEFPLLRGRAVSDPALQIRAVAHDAAVGVKIQAVGVDDIIAAVAGVADHPVLRIRAVL